MADTISGLSLKIDFSSLKTATTEIKNLDKNMDKITNDSQEMADVIKDNQEMIQHTIDITNKTYKLMDKTILNITKHMEEETKTIKQGNKEAKDNTSRQVQNYKLLGLNILKNTKTTKEHIETVKENGKTTTTTTQNMSNQFSIFGKQLPQSLAAGIGALGVMAGVAVKVAKALLDWARQSPYFSAQLGLVNFELNQFGIIVGDALAPLLQPIIDLLQQLLDQYNNLDPSIKQAINTILQVIVVFASWSTGIAELVLIIMGLDAIWKSNFLNIQGIVKALADVINGVTSFIVNLFTVDLPNALNSLSNLFGSIWNGLGDIMRGAGQLFSDIVTGIVNLFTVDIPNAIQSVENIFSNLGTDLSNIFGSIWSGITGGTSDIINEITDVLKTFINVLIDDVNIFIGYVDSLIKKIQGVSIAGVQPFSGLLSGIESSIANAKIAHFASGGVAGKDTIPAMLSPGEVVLNGSQIDRASKLFSLLKGGPTYTNIINNNNNSSRSNSNAQNVSIVINAGMGGGSGSSGNAIANSLGSVLRQKGVIS